MFRYHGFHRYPLLFAICAAAVLTLLGAQIARPYTFGYSSPQIR